MTTSALSVQDLVILGSIIGGSIAAIQGLIALGDRLWGKKKDANLERILQVLADKASAPSGCSVQHQELRQTLVEQTKNLNQLVSTLSDQIHSDELRHQALMMRLELQGKTMESSLARLERQNEELLHEHRKPKQ